MLKNFINKERLPGFRFSSFLSLSAFCLMLLGTHAYAADANIQLSDAVQASSQCGCRGDDSDSHARGRHTQNRRECCPGPKGPRGPRGPEGFPACPGVYSDFASYQLILTPDQLPVAFGPLVPIAFQRQTVIRGHSISTFPPYNTFELEAGIYEISVGISTQNSVAPVNPVNQLRLNVGARTYAFPAAIVANDFITYRKIVQIALPSDVTVTTPNTITFDSPPFATSANPGIAAYIHIVRLQ